MKGFIRLSAFAAMALLCVSCGMTSIVTVTPDYANSLSYSTVVTAPRTRTVTTAASVTPASQDISLYLDLKAVSAAFAQSSTVEEFERLINDSSYMLSNLDLNNDGFVDYLRVLETVDGHNHVFLIQAVLASDLYQDVATIVAEIPLTGRTCVQIIGDPYIYGPNFIIQPTFVVTPAIYACFAVPYYTPWRSPWYWNHFPPCYRHPAPIYLSHYQAYVTVYMRNHRFCHEVVYATTCHYPDYVVVSAPCRRNDYGLQHPERSFAQRTAEPAHRGVSAQSQAVNARDIIARQASSTRTATTSTTATRSASGSSATATRTSATATGTSSTATRQASASTSTATRKASGSTKATATRTPQTTVKSRVSTSGSSTTRTTTVSKSGSTTSVKRGSNSQPSAARTSTSARSSSTSARSSSTSARSSSGATRSSSSRR